MKSKVVKLDVDKLVPIPVSLSQLIDLVKNDVFLKKTYIYIYLYIYIYIYMLRSKILKIKYLILLA